MDPVRTVSQGMALYRRCMLAQLLLRLLDFFNMSMVIPTLSQFLESAGGSSDDYFLALVLGTTMQVVGSFGCGIFVDRTGRLLPAYVATTLAGICGNALYAMADVTAGLRRPMWILAARMLIGAGSSSFPLPLVFLGRAALPHERQRWAVLLGVSRSGGLLVGPGLAVGLGWLFGGRSRDAGGSLTSPYALPATFLVLMNVAALALLVLSWVEPPAAEQRRTEGAAPSTSGWPLLSFLAQRKAVTLIVTYFLAGFIAYGNEYLVPAVAVRLLGWTEGSGGGAVLMAIAIAVLSSQISMLWLKTRLQDRRILLLGTCGMVCMTAATLGIWLMAFGTSLPVTSALAGSRWLAVFAPFVLIEIFFPWVVTSAITTWVRIVSAELPARAGTLQAFFTNMAQAGTLVAPVWDGWSYSESRAAAEGLPWTAVIGLWLATCVQLGSVALAYTQLAPAPMEEAGAGAGLLPPNGSCELHPGSPRAATPGEIPAEAPGGVR